jgi:hypothetical protein
MATDGLGGEHQAAEKIANSGRNKRDLRMVFIEHLLDCCFEVPGEGQGERQREAMRKCSLHFGPARLASAAGESATVPSASGRGRDAAERVWGKLCDERFSHPHAA